MYKNFIIYTAIGLFLFFLISCGVSEIQKTAEPKAPAAPGPGDCISCHEGNEVLPENHVDTKGMMGDDCMTCHEEDSMSLKGKIPLSHMHQLNGVSCKECHEDPAAAKPVGTDVCQTCHGDTRALIEAASELEINPHFSPHEGKIPDCNRCHHMHKSSENYCSHCHGMDYKVP